MKKTKYIIAAVAIIVVVVAILFYNRSKMQAQSKNIYQEKYYVTVADVAQTTPSEEISMVGTVAANNDVNIISETSGRITNVFANVGDYKSAGSVIVQVDDELKKAAYNSALANYDKAKKDFERIQSLWETKSASDAQLDGARLAFINAESQLTMAKRQLNDTKITTPISGYVTFRPVDVGSYLASGPNATLVANIVDISKLKVKVNVSEKDAFRLKAGDEVKITTEVYPGQEYTGKISSISAKGDDAHTYPVEIVFPNNSNRPLKAGMFARVHFTSLMHSNIITIPREAVIGSARSPQVFVFENGIAKLKNIVVGNQYGTMIQVLAGLKVGDQVVTSGQNIIQDNYQVEVMK